MGVWRLEECIPTPVLLTEVNMMFTAFPQYLEGSKKKVPYLGVFLLTSPLSQLKFSLHRSSWLEPPKGLRVVGFVYVRLGLGTSGCQSSRAMASFPVNHYVGWIYRNKVILLRCGGATWRKGMLSLRRFNMSR